MTLPAVSALLGVAKEPDRRHGTREAIGLWRSLPEYPAQAFESSTPLWSQSVPRFLCHTSSKDLSFVGYKAGPGYRSESKILVRSLCPASQGCFSRLFRSLFCCAFSSGSFTAATPKLNCGCIFFSHQKITIR